MQFSKLLENSMILPAALRERFLFLMNWCLCVLRMLLLVAPSLTWTVVGGRRFRPLLDIWNLFLCLLWMVQQQSEPLVEELNKSTTIRTIGRGAESVVEYKPAFLRIDGCCCISVHVPTSFCLRGIRPVVLGDEKRQSECL